MTNLRPVPRFILIAVVVAGLAYGAQLFMERRAAQKAAEPTKQVVEAPTVVTPPTQAPVAATPAPAPVQAAPQEAPSTLKPAGGQDSGLDAVLKAGRK